MGFLSNVIRILFPYILLTPIMYIISYWKSNKFFKQYVRIAIIFFLLQILSELAYAIFNK